MKVSSARWRVIFALWLGELLMRYGIARLTTEQRKKILERKTQ